MCNMLMYNVRNDKAIQTEFIPRFSASDLVKNLLLSVFLERPLEEQEQILSTRWTEPIQKP